MERVSRRRFLESTGRLFLATAFAVQSNQLSRFFQKSLPFASTPSPGDRPPPPSDVLPETSFSIFWITDTQFLSESNPDAFRKMTGWIVDNWKAYNGKLVIHTGDIVQNGPEKDEWQNANSAMLTLLRNGIPYSWCAGNHDDLIRDDSGSGWTGRKSSQAFDPSYVERSIEGLGNVSWAGDFHDGMNTAVNFRAAGMDFLVVNLEWRADQSVLGWLDGLLSDPRYASSRVIVAPHAYINPFGSLHDPRWDPELGDFVNRLTPILDRHSSNVFLTLNGHFATDSGYNTPRPVKGRNELMFDRQDCTDAPGSATGRGADDTSASTPDSQKVGGATVTVLTFSIETNRMIVRTFDTFLGSWRQGPYDSYAVNLFPESDYRGIAPLLARA